MNIKGDRKEAFQEPVLNVETVVVTITRMLIGFCLRRIAPKLTKRVASSGELRLFVMEYWAMSTDLQLASGSPAQRYKDLKFYRPTREAHYLHLEGLFREPIDKQLIAENYSEMLKVAVPIKAGNLYPSTIMWRLNSFSHDNRLYLAFRELGRVIRTEFLLNLH